MGEEESAKSGAVFRAFLPGEFHGQRSLVSYRVHGVTESQT